MAAEKATNPARTAQIAKIKMAQKALKLDDDDYRAILVRVTGKASSAAMSGEERKAVLSEMNRLGWKAAPAKADPNRPKTVDQVPMLGKVQALLADQRRPWSYAHALAQKMFATDRLEFLKHNQLHALVAALQMDANRRVK